MTSENSLILSISKSLPVKKIRVGPKAHNLITAKKHGINVPDGIILSVEFMDAFRTFGNQNVNDASSSSNKSELVLESLSSDKVDALNSKLLSALNLIEFQFERKYAVRSAATIEDGKVDSYAGQFETFLNVSEKELMENVIKCYLSWWNERATSYKDHKGVNNEIPEISVIIQEYIDAEFSGVLFTSNPVTHNKQIVIEGIEGAGEQLVSGKKAPSFILEIDHYESKKPNISLIKSNGISQITEDQLLQLIKYAKALEKIFVKNLDIEWAIKENKVFILQVRPITDGSNTTNYLDIAKGKYCRTIIEDLWSDKMTNITSSIVFDELSDIYSFKKIFAKLGLKELTQIKAVEVVNGYGYLNSFLVAKILDIIPQGIRFRELTNSFHPFDRSAISKIKVKKTKIAGVLARSFLLLNDPAAFPFLTHTTLRKHQNRIKKQLNYSETYSSENLRSIFEELDRLIQLLGSLQDKNQWGYGYASLFTWLTRHYIVDFLGFDERWLLEQLRNIPDNVSIRIQSKLIEVAKLCDAHIKEEVLKKNNNKEAWLILQKDFPEHPFYLELKKFVELYGYRSSNRDFINKRWYETPEILLTHISSILSFNNSKKNSENNYSQQKSFKQAINMPIVWLLVYATKKFIALREDLRFTLDICFYKIRQLLIAVEKNESFSNIGLIENWIFFVELNELKELLKSPEIIQQLIPVINKRKDIYYTDRDKSPPIYLKQINGEFAPYAFDPDLTGNLLNTYKGVAASAGIAEGRVRIIIDEKDFDKLIEGDILVAHNTDPGWTPLFLKAKAVLVEMGGILNHCSIVAREYGIPAIVGLNDITTLLKDNQLVRVNGAAGTVEVLMS